MKHKDFNQLVEKLKTFAAQNPTAYKRRVLLLGALGYVYIFSILTILIVLTAGVVWLLFNGNTGKYGLGKILVFLGILDFLIIKSLWVKLSPPTGLKVTRNEAPQLFKVIEEIQKQQNSILPDAVLLSDDFNAFISQVPKLGMFGWYRNYLVLGLPYMLSCTPQQFKAVLAHEFGHFSGSHGRIGSWIYRIRISWYNIVENMEQETQFGDLLFRWFFNWYVPYFNAYSFVLAREHEYEADRYANVYAGAQANAEELVNSAIKGHALGYHWQVIWQRVNEQPLPPTDVFSSAAPLLKRTVPAAEYREHLEKCLRIRTQNDDTHPSLTDRLSALGYQLNGDQIVSAQGEPLELQRDLTVSAAEEFLGEAFVQNSLRHFDHQWTADVKDNWTQRHEDVSAMKKKLTAFNQKLAEGKLSTDELNERAYMIDQIGTREEAVAAINEFLACVPDNAPAHYRLGELLLESNNERGVTHLQKSMELNAAYRSSVLEKIRWYHEARGEYEQVETIHDDLDETIEKDQQAYAERNRVIGKDQFKAHGLSAVAIERVLKLMEPFVSEMKEAYLVQKELKFYPEDPMFVMAVAGKPKWSTLDPHAFNQKLLNKLAENVYLENVEGTIYFLVGDPAVLKKSKKINNALIYKHQ